MTSAAPATSRRTRRIAPDHLDHGHDVDVLAAAGGLGSAEPDLSCSQGGGGPDWGVGGHDAPRWTPRCSMTRWPPRPLCSARMRSPGPGSGPGPPLCCRSQSGPYEHIVRVMYRESPLPSLRGTTLVFQHVLDPTPSPVSHQVPILGRAWVGRPTASGWPQSPPRCRGCAQHVPGRPAPLKVRRRSLTLARKVHRRAARPGVAR